MKIQLIYVAIFAFAIVGLLIMNGETDVVLSQSPVENSPRQSENPELEELIRELRDRDKRKSHPKQLAELINRARIVVGANTFVYKETETLSPKVYSQELLFALIDLLDWEQPRRRDDFDPAYGMAVFPAVDAIVAMRKSALPSLVEVIETERRESVKYQNALKSLRFILNRNDIEAINFLTVQASASKSRMGKKQLLSAAEIVQKDFEKSQQRVN